MGVNALQYYYDDRKPFVRFSVYIHDVVGSSSSTTNTISRMRTIFHRHTTRRISNLVKDVAVVKRAFPKIVCTLMNCRNEIGRLR